MAQDTGYQCLHAFYKCVIHLYQHEYLRRPTEADIEWLTAKHEQVHGFPGMLGSIDCMHWVGGTVQWHGKGSTPGATRAPKVKFSVNGEQFTKGYYLADGIYPKWATLVKSFKCPMDPKATKFKRYQEAARKDVVDNGRAITEFEEELIANTTLPTRTWTERCSTQLRMYGELRDRMAHHQLRNTLIEHVWNLPEHGRQR
uniref:uncharacterized protein LOC122609037 n=1 Tax=Erigeron canadensis TaxID=72917 RepID=UPI001CB8DC23|nr:uncharacterized protein LOC122609037 [Erigeron canadensis]